MTFVKSNPTCDKSSFELVRGKLLRQTHQQKAKAKLDNPSAKTKIRNKMLARLLESEPKRQIIETITLCNITRKTAFSL